MAFTYESIGSHRVTDIFKVDDWFGGCCDRSHEIEEGEETPRNDGSRCVSRRYFRIKDRFWEGMCSLCSARERASQFRSVDLSEKGYR
jgi:hypothetical protein